MSHAWLELAETRELGVTAQPSPELATRLRRLALALQVHGFLVPDLSDETIRAAAFVAAEALDIARGYELEEPSPQDRIVAGLLYLVAGYDANAAVVVRGVELDEDVEATHRYALAALLAFLTGGPVPVAPAAQNPDLLHERVRALLWRELGDRVVGFVSWLRDPRAQDGGDRDRLTELLATVQTAEDAVELNLGNGDIDHLVWLTRRAIDAASARALRNVAPPLQLPERFEEFLVRRCRTQPLLWPAAASYAQLALPGPEQSAVVAVPTGAGKSGVADLAIQHAATTGWILYLAPTNALVSQIRRQLRTDHPGITIREFFGGAEYTTLTGETLQAVTAGQVFVMTPEKCSLALRQSPEAFANMSLCVLDEAHILGDDHGRGQLTELVLSEVLARAPTGQVLLMSALIANPEALADWLIGSHDKPTGVIREPWRPTRTLRAVIGLEDQTLKAAAEPAVRELEQLPNRRNVKFDASLAALAGLYGPWSTADEDDYTLVKVAATISVNVTRSARGGEIGINTPALSVRPTVEALAQLLGERGQKVMAFLPRSRHDSFAAAISMTGFGAVELPEDIEALLLLASTELGLPTLLRDTLGKGIGVHTSALLTEERRASELAFQGEVATVLFATGTLAQGLNLPATTVIIGGTEIGYAPDQSHDEKRDRERAQLLNAIGRAGRARVAARSLALVVPSKLPVFDDQTPASSVLEHAEFLAEEDSSTILLAALRDLLQRFLSDRVTLADIRPRDQIALSYLAPAQDEDGVSGQVLRGTWAVHQLRIQDEIAHVAQGLAEVTAAALAEGDTPVWATEAARRAAVPIPVAVGLTAYIRDSELANAPPDSVEGWAGTLIDALRRLPASSLALILDRDAFASTALQNLSSEDNAARAASFAAFSASLTAWLSGWSLAGVGGAVHASERLTDPGRGPRNPIPRTIRTIEQGLGFGVTKAAGAMAAVIDVAVAAGASTPLPSRSQAALELLPIALRYGATGDALAFIRAGARPRAVAHLLARLAPNGPDGADADELQHWASRQMSEIMDRLGDLEVTQPEQALLDAFARADRVR